MFGQFFEFAYICPYESLQVGYADSSKVIRCTLYLSSEGMYWSGV